MADIDTQFQKAVYLIRNGPPKEGTSNDEKLAVYSLYKQATEGDVTGSQPWAVQMEARAKWDAWAEHKGMGKDDAKKAYVDLLAKGDPTWESHDVLKGFTPQ
jgi:diazepam-binding inhibitor (GABA receptor modulator, acyl-CoA-binding protein)